MTEPRYRISAKQTAKGMWYFDATVEMDRPSSNESNPKDAADITQKTIGKELLQLITNTEHEFANAGKKLAEAAS